MKHSYAVINNATGKRVKDSTVGNKQDAKAIRNELSMEAGYKPLEEGQFKAHPNEKGMPYRVTTVRS